MSVTVQSIPMFSDNYAWLIRNTETGVTGVIDPADPAAASAAIEAAGGRLDLILLTHHHADHIAGADDIRARYHARIAGAAADAYRLPRLDIAVTEGDLIPFGDAQIRVIDTPGHTRGHIAFFIEGADLLFCGDTLFSLGCGRLLEGTAAEMFTSLQKLARLPADTQICCGHEYTLQNARFALTVDPENPALRTRAAEIDALRAEGRPTLPALLATELAANPFLRAPTPARLAQIRAAKDSF